jgi:hypothetical protein
MPSEDVARADAILTGLRRSASASPGGLARRGASASSPSSPLRRDVPVRAGGGATAEKPAPRSPLVPPATAATPVAEKAWSQRVLLQDLHAHARAADVEGDMRASVTRQFQWQNWCDFIRPIVEKK